MTRPDRVLALAVMLAVCGPSGADEPVRCEDPVFLQTEARIAEFRSTAEQVRGWQGFLGNHPDNPCADLARARVEALVASVRMGDEKAGRDHWEQEARGGVVEPNRDEFPTHTVFPDAHPVDRVRVLSEVIWLGDGFKSDYGEENIQLKVDREAVWTLLLRGEWAVISHLALQVDLPLVAGGLRDEGFLFALGNIGVGIRGIWGTRLGEGRYPWVISGGILWGSGSSLWSGNRNAPLLEAAAVGGAHLRHCYRYDSPDYAIHVESQIGIGEHFLGLGLTYHVYAGGEHVEKILRFDLAWDWRASGWIEAGVEINGGLGDGEPRVGATANEFMFFVYASPVARLRFERYSAAVALRVPLADARDWSRLVFAVELAVGL